MKGNASVLSKTVLGLNALILITNFFLCLATTNAQGEMNLVASRSSPGRIMQQQSSATDFLRLVSSLEGVLPPATIDSLTPEQLQAVSDALDRYRRTVDARLPIALYAKSDVSARRRLQDLNKDARDEVEQTIRTAIRDDAVVGQLTTAVVRFG